MRDTCIPKGLVTEVEVSTKKSAMFNLNKWLRDKLKKRLNVGFYDECCPETNDLTKLPVVFDSVSNTLKRFNPETGTYVNVGDGVV